MKNNFKVGDRVHFTTAGEKVFKIVGIDSSQIPYELESIDNLDETFFTIESNIKLIPTMKNIKDLGEKVAIQCKTPEAFIEISKQLGGRTLNVNYWDTYKEYSCIDSSDNCWESIGWYKSQGYTILQASDFMPLSPQDEIKELKERIATIEESLRPKKKIEFVKYLSVIDMQLNPKASDPKDFENVELFHKNGKYDIIKAWDNGSEIFIFLGYWNDGIK